MVVAAAVTFGYLYVLSHPIGHVPALGHLLDPRQGVYDNARQAPYDKRSTLNLPILTAPVTVVRDQRGVPHIYASSNADAITALGYVVASDRLFQMDFLPRVARGRLSEVLGQESVAADRFLRSTGMNWGIEKNAQRIRRENGVEHDLVQWYASGVNAYINQTPAHELPIEFRLLGYRPEPYSLERVLGILQYMNYDLTYRTDNPMYSAVRTRIGGKAFEKLYPLHSRLYTPIIPDQQAQSGTKPLIEAISAAPAKKVQWQRPSLVKAITGGEVPGKGSNNWAVQKDKSATGAPILAGDMHLQLSLPSIWYEVHLVTPTMNTYGVTVPGAPLPVEAFNETLGWTFTNTGADQIDHYALKLDSAKTHYRYLNGWRKLRLVRDTIEVAGDEPIIDTLRYSHWGPVMMSGPDPMAIQWTAHKPSATLKALWQMNRADSLSAFEAGLRDWDTPMQNVLYADTAGNLAIRSTGYLPTRAAGHGRGLLDGSSRIFEWTGRVPFEELPHAINPSQHYLASSNQQPTGKNYPYYLGHNWRDSYRSIRIDSLLQTKDGHTVEDIKNYQSDVHVVQRDLFVPFVDTLRGLSPRARELRSLLVEWNGRAGKDRPEPTVFRTFLKVLKRMAWDELEGYPVPEETQLVYLLNREPDSRWLDNKETPPLEDADALLKNALEATADTLTNRYGWGAEHWRWGDHHKLILKHITSSEALRSFWEGPFSYPGFSNTVSPAADLQVTHSASWRVVVDFSTSPPRGYGIYPGGQSGNPFSRWYNLHTDRYLRFGHYRLHNYKSVDRFSDDQITSRITLAP